MGDIFKGFIEQSKEKIDGTVLHLFTPYFSTTTSDIEYASQIAIISIVSPFVKFIKRFEPCIIGGCGFPYINLQGTLQDYKQLKMKIEGLKINLHPNLKPRGEHHFTGPLIQNFKKRFIALYRCSMDLNKMI